jgi:predicted RNA-binding Zn-ribbon protein involved in translation (DUF1610 family)
MLEAGLIVGEINNLPVITVNANERKIWFRCPLCGKTHTHGVDKWFRTTGITWRSPHCSTKSVEDYILIRKNHWLLRPSVKKWVKKDGESYEPKTL